MSSIKYIKEIDTLRAIAVLAVLLFHFKVPYFEGGFIGVDVFFVISGYLITTIILKQIESKSFSFKTFYLKRAQRLLPAFLVVSAVSYIIGLFILPNSLVQDMSKSLIAAITSTSNIFFFFTSDYFSHDNDLRPFLHTWSLSIEEQYYLIWPISLVAGYRFLKKPKLIFLSLFICSYGFGNLLLDNSPSSNFFLLPARIFEFGIGCAIPILKIEKFKSKTAGNLCLILGTLFILFGILYVDSSTPFPSWHFFMACLGVPLVILSRDSKALSVIYQNSFLHYIGKISYSLYLVHWPVFVFTSYYLIADIGILSQAFMFGLSFLLAHLSYTYIENPLRERKAHSKFVYIASFSFGVCLVMSLVWLNLSKDTPDMDELAKSHLLALKKENSIHNKYTRKGKCYTSKTQDLNSDCIVGSPNKKLIIGDSTAAALYAGIIHASSEPNIWDLAASASCRPTTQHTNSGSQACKKRNAKTYGNIENLKKYGTVYLTGAFHKDISINQFIKDAKHLKQNGVKVSVIGPHYSIRRSMMELLEGYGTNYTYDQIIRRITPKLIDKQFFVTDQKLRKKFQKENIPYISMIQILCQDLEPESCLITSPKDNSPILRDTGHLSLSGGEVIYPRL